MNVDIIFVLFSVWIIIGTLVFLVKNSELSELFDVLIELIFWPKKLFNKKDKE